MLILHEACAIIAGSFIVAAATRVDGRLVSATDRVPAQAAPAANPGVNEDARTLADFKALVDAYASLRKNVDATLPTLGKEATPEAIDRHQRELAALIQSARAEARQGDLFTPKTRALITTLLERLFAQTDRQKLRQSIQDENPGNVRLTINGRYPDAVPLASMPAEVLNNLPRLPDELEYRFVGDTLILLDPKAHIIVDFMTGAMPR